MPNDAMSLMPLNFGDPATANWFLLEIDNVEIGIFREVKGLTMTVKTVEIPEGGQNQYVFKAPGQISWPNIVLRRGLTQSDALFEWISKSSGEGFAGNKNQLQRNSGAISALNSQGTRLRSWNIIEAFPVQWRGPEFSADNHRAQLEEELEIAHHGFRSTTFAS